MFVNTVLASSDDEIEEKKLPRSVNNVVNSTNYANTESSSTAGQEVEEKTPLQSTNNNSTNSNVNSMQHSIDDKVVEKKLSKPGESFNSYVDGFIRLKAAGIDVDVDSNKMLDADMKNTKSNNDVKIAKTNAKREIEQTISTNATKLRTAELENNRQITIAHKQSEDTKNSKKYEAKTGAISHCVSTIGSSAVSTAIQTIAAPVIIAYCAPQTAVTAVTQVLPALMPDIIKTVTPTTHSIMPAAASSSQESSIKEIEPKAL